MPQKNALVAVSNQAEKTVINLATADIVAKCAVTVSG
jgi:hypothetical protein